LVAAAERRTGVVANIEHLEKWMIDLPQQT
jgi:hypothetical protein